MDRIGICGKIFGNRRNLKDNRKEEIRCYETRHGKRTIFLIVSREGRKTGKSYPAYCEYTGNISNITNNEKYWQATNGNIYISWTNQNKARVKRNDKTVDVSIQYISPNRPTAECVRFEYVGIVKKIDIER